MMCSIVCNLESTSLFPPVVVVFEEYLRQPWAYRPPPLFHVSVVTSFGGTRVAQGTRAGGVRVGNPCCTDGFSRILHPPRRTAVLNT